jgi:mannitol-1-phosphate 5-dehydrogenase
MPKVVQIGCGKAASGCLLPNYQDSDIEIVGCESHSGLYNLYSGNGNSYNVSMLGPNAFGTKVCKISRLYVSGDEGVTDDIGDSTFVGVSVHEKDLKSACGTIADGLIKRKKRGSGPLNILITMNKVGAAKDAEKYIKEALKQRGAGYVTDSDYVCTPAVTFGTCHHIMRDNNNKPTAFADDYGKIIVSGEVAEDLPDIEGLQKVGDIAAWEDAKMYAYNMLHFISGLQGLKTGKKVVYEINKNSDEYFLIDSAMTEAVNALINKYPKEFSQLWYEGSAPFKEELIERAFNKDLGDSCNRLVNDLTRKLRKDDRLLGSAQLAIDNLPYNPMDIIRGGLAAFELKDTGIEGVSEVQDILAKKGIDGVLEEICGIASGDLAYLIRSQYNER